MGIARELDAHKKDNEDFPVRLFLSASSLYLLLLLPSPVAGEGNESCANCLSFVLSASDLLTLLLD